MPDQTTTVVIFGASGDLTRKKLAPALADLYSKGRLGPEIHIVGVSRTDMTADEFRAAFYEGFGLDPDFPPATPVTATSQPPTAFASWSARCPISTRLTGPPTGSTTWHWLPSSSPPPSRPWAAPGTSAKKAVGGASSWKNPSAPILKRPTSSTA